MLAFAVLAYAGLDIGLVLRASLIFGALMDHGQYRDVLLALVPAVLIASAFNVRRVRRTALAAA